MVVCTIVVPGAVEVETRVSTVTKTTVTGVGDGVTMIVVRMTCMPPEKDTPAPLGRTVPVAHDDVRSVVTTLAGSEAGAEG